MRATGKFVVVHNGSRDAYQVAWALAEAGRLEALVTDFYAPAWLARRSGFFARRHCPAVPWRLTRSIWPVFAIWLLASLLRFPLARVFPYTDALLARRAARLARRRGAALLCYGSYVPLAEEARGVRVVDFEYHPHPAATHAILAEDVARFPEARESFAAEERDLALVSGDEPWRRAHAIVCASSMTRRSLEFAGAQGERIAVVPYGAMPPEPVAPRERGPCRFLFVGQGIQRKGPHHLIRAWQARERGADEATLAMVCYRIDPGIAALATAQGIALLGRQSSEELAALYEAADVFVMPSLVEGFGLVYLEAMARGCHLIGTTNTGLPDLGLSAAAATIVAPGDIAGLAAALDRLSERKRAGALDPAAIAAEGLRWQWPDFRAGVRKAVDRLER